MKILYISPRYEGGIGGHAKRVAEKLREHGHDVKLMKSPHIPIKKLKNPSFVIFGKLKALLDNETYEGQEKTYTLTVDSNGGQGSYLSLIHI